MNKKGLKVKHGFAKKLGRIIGDVLAYGMLTIGMIILVELIFIKLMF